MSLRNPAWKLANRSKPAEGSGHIERLFFAKAKQMDGIGDDKYWRKCLPGKLPKYGRDKKSHEALQKLKGILHVASCGEWQLDYKIPGKHCQYYSTNQRELFQGKSQIY